MFIASLACLLMCVVDGKVVENAQQQDEITNNSLDIVSEGKEDNEGDVTDSGPPKNASSFLDLHIHLPESCFPSEAFVRNENNDKILMKNLKIGDKVLTTDYHGNAKQSEVILMLHQDRKRTIDDYVTITMDVPSSITMSTYHLIRSNDKFVYAKDVRAGHTLTVYDERTTSYQKRKVVSVELVTKQGMFAPLTMDGTIVVNDVLASCYASFPSHSISHFGFSVWRLLYTYFHAFLDLTSEPIGVHWYPRLLMTMCGYK